MRHETLSIGSSPSGEDCVQVGTAGYAIYGRKEARAFKHQLEREFPITHLIRAYFKITSNSHDFGTYLDVEVVYDADDKASVNYALNVEANMPEHWDKQAHQELGLHYFATIAAYKEELERNNRSHDSDSTDY